MLLDAVATIDESAQKRRVARRQAPTRPRIDRWSKQRNYGRVEGTPQSRRQIASHVLDAPRDDEGGLLKQRRLFSSFDSVHGGHAKPRSGELSQGDFTHKWIVFNDQ